MRNEKRKTKNEVEKREEVVSYPSKKHALLQEGLEAISEDIIDLLILKGEPGVGKTHSTLKTLNEKEVDYAYINSYATPLSFYEILFRNKDKKVIIFDDLYGINNHIIMAMLKAACWASDEGKKIVSYYSTSRESRVEGLPESFEMNSHIILIFNENVRGYEPIVDRGVCISFNLTFEEKIKLLEEVVKQEGNTEVDEEVFKYIKENTNNATKNLSVRTLVTLSRLHCAGHDFKAFADEMLQVDEDKQLLLDLSADDWVQETGHHKRTYYKQRKRYGIN